MKWSGVGSVWGVLLMRVPVGVVLCEMEWSGKCMGCPSYEGSCWSCIL